MKDKEFYQKYANLPLSKRDIPISAELGYITPTALYKAVKAIDDKIRADMIMKQKLIRAFGSFINNKI